MVTKVLATNKSWLTVKVSLASIETVGCTVKSFPSAKICPGTIIWLYAGTITVSLTAMLNTWLIWLCTAQGTGLPDMSKIGVKINVASEFIQEIISEHGGSFHFSYCHRL